MKRQTQALLQFPVTGGSASFNNTVFEGSIASGSGSAEIPPSLRSGSSHVFVPSDAGGGAWEQQASEATPRKRPRLVRAVPPASRVSTWRCNVQQPHGLLGHARTEAMSNQVQYDLLCYRAKLRRSCCSSEVF